MTNWGMVIDLRKCIGCYSCMISCKQEHFLPPGMFWNRLVIGETGIFPAVTKQIYPVLCNHCVEAACVKACPTDALVLGERDRLLTEARRRITARPGKYVNHVYGEKEAGGTSWLYISPVPFTDLGFPELGEEHVTLTSEAVLNSTPVSIIAAVAGLSGLYWLTKRRDQMKAEEG